MMDPRDPEQVLMSAITAVLENERVAQDLETLYPLLKGAGLLEDENLKGMEEELVEMLSPDGFIAEMASKSSNLSNSDKEELEVRLSKMSNQIIAFLWIHRISVSVSDYHHVVNVMKNVMSLKRSLDDASQFQEDNR